MIISGWSKSIYYILFMVILTTTYGPNRSPRQQIQLEKSSKEATSGVGVLYWSAQRSRAWDLWRVFLLSHQSHLIDLLIFFQWKRRGSQLWGLVKCWFLPKFSKKKRLIKPLDTSFVSREAQRIPPWSHEPAIAFCAVVSVVSHSIHELGVSLRFVLFILTNLFPF